MGRGHMRVWPKLSHGGHRPLLVYRVGVGVDEEDTHRFATRFEQRTRLRAHLLQIDQRVQRAIGQHALIDLQPQVARNHWQEGAAQSPGLRPVTPAHLQHIAETARRDDAGSRHLALQQRVGTDCGAVHDGGDGRGRIGHACNAVHEAARFLAAGRRHLDDARRALRFVEHKEVGEGAADVHADHQTRCESGRALFVDFRHFT